MKYLNFLKENKFIIGILLIASFLRLYKLDFQSPWLDELSTILVSDPDLTNSRTHELIMNREGFPHLYFLTLKFLCDIFGHTILVLRLFSVFFGILSVYLMFLFVKELINKKAGYISGLLLTVNFFHIYHSREARAYALLVFFVILASYRLVKFIKNISLKNAILLGITAGLIPNAHPMGLLNILVIYLTLLFVIFYEKDLKQRFQIFKLSFLAGIFTILAFLPAYPLISKVSEIKSFWIPEASFETILQAFVELLGGSLFISYIYFGALFLFFIITIYKLFIKKENQQLNTLILVLTLVWLLINVGVIVAKSYLDVSIILNRYFIGTLPLFIMVLAYLITSIKQNTVQIILITIFSVYSLYYLFYEKSYYTEISKSEYVKITKELSDKNVNNDKIYSAYGFVLNTMFKNTPSYNLVTEMTFENYVKSLRNNAINKESFWYIDGNFRPYSLSKEDENYLEENFELDYDLNNYYDTWAKHYSLKHEEKNLVMNSNEIKFFLNEFKPSIQDEKGSLYMFQNGSVTSKEVNLYEGKYELIINANSLPEQKVNKENAHISIKIADKELINYFLSEKKSESEKKIQFEINSKQKASFQISFDNDLTVGKLDRNVIIYNLILRKL
jgi:mannosyltransferase